AECNHHICREWRKHILDCRDYADCDVKRPDRKLAQPVDDRFDVHSAPAFASRAIVTTAMHARPSPRPIHPIPSLVFPLKPTSFLVTPRTAASDSLISSRNLETRGCSVTIVTSAFITTQLRCHTSSTAWPSISIESRPLFAGSVSGNNDPMSCSLPAAPSSASVSACATASPSE